MIKFALVFGLIFFVSGASNFYIGVGRSDITGPAAEIGMMGYAAIDQKTAGIHFRQYARAFVFYDPKTSKRVAYVNLDLAFVTIMIKKNVITELNNLFPGLYTQQNVLLTATHTHSGPGGYSWYTMYDITTWGWKKINVDSIVAGIVDSISKAHKTLQPGNAFVQTGILKDPMTNRNRSPTAYANNPAGELKNYTDDVDKDSVVLKLVSESGTEIGSMNWFAVHGTSMNKTNKLISGDNKGYAMYLFEQKMNPGALPGQGAFVASFSNSNEGDSSPNTKGAFCPNGLPCDPIHSTCNGRTQDCIAIGPGANMYQSTQIIGSQQFNSAYALYQQANTPLRPGVASVHQFADMSKVTVQPEFTGLTSAVTTCLAALGDSFAAGTTDGPGEFNFIQGNNNTGNPFWNFIAGFLSRPTDAQKACHAPKPILLNTGGCYLPTPWTPSILPLQIFNIGQLYIVGVPGEFTTMSGRRLKKTVRDAVIAHGGPADAIVVIAGLANAYSQYTTTKEEYAVQRYEGASTLFGPNQLAAYQQLYSSLAYYLVRNGSNPNPGPTPTDYTKDLIDLQPGVWFDDGPIGNVITQVRSSYQRGQTVLVKFYTGHPNNNVKRPTFMTVDQQQPDGKSYKVIATDANWETTYTWDRIPSIILAESSATLQWTIPLATPPGLYRITHYGDKKAIITGKITPFTAYSAVFRVQ